MDSKRLAELDGEIAEADRKIWAEHNRSKTAVADPFSPEAHRGETFRAASRARSLALEGAIDLLLAKRANIQAGLAEDFGIAAPINLELIVNAQLADIRRTWRQEFVEFRDHMLTAVAHATVRQVSSGLKDVGDRIALIEQYGVHYLGVWQRQAAYDVGSLVTFKGSMWHANEDSVGAEPGSGPGWTLAVKAGRDGKDSHTP